MIKQMTMKELEQNKKDSMIDVREVFEYEEGHIPGAINIPLSQLEEKYDQLDKDKEHFIICRSGGRSMKASELLAKKGYNVTNVQGGMLAYEGEVEV